MLLIYLESICKTREEAQYTKSFSTMQGKVQCNHLWMKSKCQNSTKFLFFNKIVWAKTNIFEHYVVTQTNTNQCRIYPIGSDIERLVMFLLGVGDDTFNGVQENPYLYWTNFSSAGLPNCTVLRSFSVYFCIENLCWNGIRKSKTISKEWLCKDQVLYT